MSIILILIPTTIIPILIATIIINTDTTTTILNTTCTMIPTLIQAQMTLSAPTHARTGCDRESGRVDVHVLFHAGARDRLGISQA